MCFDLFFLNTSSHLCFWFFAVRSEVSRLEQVVEDLKSQLRGHDSIPTRDGGLSGGDFRLPESVRSNLQTTIDRLTKYVSLCLCLCVCEEVCGRVMGLTA